MVSGPPGHRVASGVTWTLGQPSSPAQSRALRKCRAVAEETGVAEVLGALKAPRVAAGLGVVKVPCVADAPCTA